MTAQERKNIISTFIYTELRYCEIPSLDKITTVLSEFSREERKEIVSIVEDGCAPLFLACERGYIEIVKYLVQHCDADIEQLGIFERCEGPHEVTPLWCASVSDKLNVVQYLVTQGANINSESNIGYTPVNAACFLSLYEIVRYLIENNADILKPNYEGGTCLINAIQSVPLCELLIQHGADVNAQDILGRTALHYAIQECRFEITKLLVEKGADLFLISRYGDDVLETACLKCAVREFDYLCENYNYSIQRIALSHELMGSSFFNFHNNRYECLNHWRLALSIRRDNMIPKSLKSKAPYAAEMTEFNSEEHLENLSWQEMWIQSLLVCERILGPYHNNFIYRVLIYIIQYVNHLTHDGVNSLDFANCVNLCKYALEILIQTRDLLDGDVSLIVEILVELFLEFQKQYPQKVQFNDVHETMRILVSRFAESNYLFSVRPVFRVRQHVIFDEILFLFTKLILVCHNILKTPEQMKKMEHVIKDLLKLNTRNSRGETILHIAVSKSYYDQAFPNVTIVKILLNCDADVEVVTDNLLTPLHIAVQKNNHIPEVLQVLLKYGAHIDRRNGHGEIMLENVLKCNINLLHYTNLQCLAARKIIEERIPFVGKVSSRLEKFISVH